MGVSGTVPNRSEVYRLRIRNRSGTVLNSSKWFLDFGGLRNRSEPFRENTRNRSEPFHGPSKLYNIYNHITFMLLKKKSDVLFNITFCNYMFKQMKA